MSMNQADNNEKPFVQRAAPPDYPWINPNPRGQGYGDWPDAGNQVEFITEFGVTHLGIAMDAMSGNRTKVNPAFHQVILMSEDTDQPEFFARHQIEKWRITDSKVKKKRFLGQTNHADLRVSGYLSAIFVNYLGMRLNERRKEKDDERPRILQPDTYHFENEEGKQQWETRIWYRDGSVTLIEVDGNDFILVKAEEGLPTNHPLFHPTNQYHYKDVARCCERLCDYLFGEKYFEKAY